MRKRPEDTRFFKSTKAPRDRTLFNGQLLDQRREEAYVALRRMGLIR